MVTQVSVQKPDANLGTRLAQIGKSATANILQKIGSTKNRKCTRVHFLVDSHLLLY